MIAIPLKEVVFDERARNGAWCCHPYPGHPKGCPNFTKGCTARRPDFRTIADRYIWTAFMITFDLKAHAEYMKARVWAKSKVEWTDRQCRNPLYWQGSIRAEFRNSIVVTENDIVLDIPEACGVDVFETMAKAGVIIERHPDTVRKVVLVGTPIPAPCGVVGARGSSSELPAGSVRKTTERRE